MYSVKKTDRVVDGAAGAARGPANLPALDPGDELVHVHDEADEHLHDDRHEQVSMYPRSVAP